MNGPFNASGKTGAKIVVATSDRRLIPNYLQEAFCPQPPVDLADDNRADSWLLVQSHQLAGHHGLVRCPWWTFIGEP
jgi:hypothetical protein